MEYKYVARDTGGRRVTGVIEAPNPRVVARELRSQGLYPLSVAPKRPGLTIPLPFLDRVPLKQVALFTRQVAAMIGSGIPLPAALGTVAEQVKNKRLRQVLRDVKEMVEGGEKFSEALSKYPKVFDRLFISMVEAGEATGNLDVMLNRYFTYVEKVLALRRKVVTAMVYPTVVLVLAIGIVAFLLIKIVPTFTALFKEAGVELPALTLFIINLSTFLKTNFVYIFWGLVAFFALFRFSLRNENVRRAYDRVKLRMFVIGPLFRKVSVARFSRTLATMVKSGIPILDALDIIAKTSGNKVIEEAVLKARLEVARGESLSKTLKELGVFPSMVVEMMAAGEQTGALDEMMDKVADFFEDEVDAAVAALTSILEPLMLIFLGGFIGLIVIALYLPIFKMAATIK
ncbi:MAG: type II secretion system F family protein [Aquificota bacterium]|nr:MAG: type II secretion system F family protein [Aquificota bacterium]